jgi:hypothetical protein
MPPRHAYWTIIYGNQPTSFRAATQDELLPTLGQLRTKHPDAIMMWFARGRLWPSPEAAREALVRQRTRPRFQTDRPKGPEAVHGRERRPDGPRGDSTRPPSKPRWPKREGSPGEKTGDARRGRGWRPGGTHTDPRDRFKVPRDEKRRRFAAQLRRDAHSPRPARGKPPHKPFKKKDGDK